MSTPLRFDRQTELGPYIAWIRKLDDSEYTVFVQVGEHPLTGDDEATFETEEDALRAADELAHRLQR
ncbi:hypothetical protein [Frateuria sp. Soil773]|uniref:hypothetical protein n=1 Tax=Frateuria sp. Soil773 TaxID=1736407 RepID=UPI0012F95186|nr:hypothetical protein [Frateuria sp. Soil773]